MGRFLPRFTTAQASIERDVSLLAALAICARAADAEDAAMLLEACGLIEAAS